MQWKPAIKSARFLQKKHLLIIIPQYRPLPRGPLLKTTLYILESLNSSRFFRTFKYDAPNAFLC